MPVLEGVLQDKLARAVIPLDSRVIAGGGTVFLYNHLIRAAEGPGAPEPVGEFVIAVGELIDQPLIATITRRAMVKPPGVAADSIVLNQQNQPWVRQPAPLDRLAVHGFFQLREHARSKGSGHAGDHRRNDRQSG